MTCPASRSGAVLFIAHVKSLPSLTSALAVAVDRASVWSYRGSQGPRLFQQDIYPVLRRHAATKRTGWFNFIFESPRLVIGQSTRPLATTTTFVSTNFEQNQGHDSPAAPSGQTTFIFESPRLDIGHSTHLPHIPLQPKHSQSKARA